MSKIRITGVSVLAMSIIALAGCSTKSGLTYKMHEAPEQPPTTVYKLNGYNGPTAMDSNEVLDASRECIMVKMRPRVTHVTVLTDAGKVRVPVQVTCEPF